MSPSPLGPPASALTRAYHVSYPFVFRHRDDIFMIPESLENETVDLYRAVDFPSGWVLEQRLLSGVYAVDATLFEESSRLWLFLNLAEPGASLNDELHVYSSASLVGPWVAHPENPVVSDVRRARPAGRIFRHGGRLIRPSQDCSHGYGTAVVFIPQARAGSVVDRISDCSRGDGDRGLTRTGRGYIWTGDKHSLDLGHLVVEPQADVRLPIG